MRKKNGFISMTLVYTFLILFMFLMLAILRTYTEKNKFLDAINEQINNDIGVAKGSRVTVINRLLEDNMPNADFGIRYFNISNNEVGNGNNLYYMENRTYSNYNYNLSNLTDENADAHTSRIYYFRGSVENNHLVFAGLCFRIIRTNEDGSIRVVYNGQASSNKCKTLDQTNFSSISIGSAKFSSSDDTPTVEYVATDSNNVVPPADDSNIQSPIISILNEWYKEKFVNTTNYTEYISKSSVFCNNKNTYQGSSFYQSRELSPVFDNPSNQNIYTNSNIRTIISFNCANNNDRFSITDGNLLYPIGLLTAQDIVLAGGYLDIGDEDVYHGGPTGIVDNESFYLYSSNSYWTMSPLSNDGKMIYFDGSGSNGVLKGALSTASYAIRPVISLNSNIVISYGDGSANNPYIVRTN